MTGISVIIKRVSLFKKKKLILENAAYTKGQENEDLLPKTK